jgi:hypothetical protein
MMFDDLRITTHHVKSIDDLSYTNTNQILYFDHFENVNFHIYFYLQKYIFHNDGNKVCLLRCVSMMFNDLGITTVQLKIINDLSYV